MKLALLSPDDRELLKRYDLDQPIMPAVEAALLEGLAKQPDLEVHYISCLQQPVRSPEKLADNIWFHSLYVPKIGWLRTGYQGCIRAVRRKLGELRPDIVHGQGTERDCAMSAVLSGFPNVITIHGNMKAVAEFYHSPIGSFHWLAARLETLALRKTNGVFCNSAYTEGVVAPRTKHTWRVPNPVRTTFFDQPPISPRSSHPILLNVGLLSAHKRQTEILAVARRLWQRGFRFEIQFAGVIDKKKPYGADFMRQLDEAKSLGYAKHFGVLSMDKLIAAFDTASALVHFPAEESFGLVVAEALARNLKLFGASVGGLIDIAANVEGSELLPMNDWTALENSIACWLETGCPRPRGAAAIMRQRYHPEIIARQHVEIYNEFLRV
jgi:glycosyltransferase involved in cell wall biosynthesis